MAEYQHTESINAEARTVFEYLQNVQNMPAYLPTVKKATSQGKDRIRIQGNAAGHDYDSDGFFKVDHKQLRMDWGSDGENEYRGWLQVYQEGDGSCKVTVHLSFEPRPQHAKEFERHGGDRHSAIQEGLQNALRIIKNLCEGQTSNMHEHAAASHASRE